LTVPEEISLNSGMVKGQRREKASLNQKTKDVWSQSASNSATQSVDALEKTLYTSAAGTDLDLELRSQEFFIWKR
jgi:hypothetical protein